MKLQLKFEDIELEKFYVNGSKEVFKCININPDLKSRRIIAENIFESKIRFDVNPRYNDKIFFGNRSSIENQPHPGFLLCREATEKEIENFYKYKKFWKLRKTK